MPKRKRGDAVNAAPKSHNRTKAETVSPMLEQKKRRRRRRRSRSQVVAQRVLIDIRNKQRDFLRQASAMLSDALGFEVRVSLVKVKPDLSPDMRRAARMTRSQARRQMAEAMQAPIVRTPAGKSVLAELSDSLADL